MLTISTGLGRVKPGDIIQLKSGSYTSNDESCKWCSERPIWTKQRCEITRSIPDIKSTAECVLKCRTDVTCEYCSLAKNECCCSTNLLPRVHFQIPEEGESRTES